MMVIKEIIYNFDLKTINVKFKKPVQLFYNEKLIGSTNYLIFDIGEEELILDDCEVFKYYVDDFVNGNNHKTKKQLFFYIGDYVIRNSKIQEITQEVNLAWSFVVLNLEQFNNEEVK
jgi:hypothetical protein